MQLATTLQGEGEHGEVKALPLEGQGGPAEENTELRRHDDQVRCTSTKPEEIASENRTQKRPRGEVVLHQNESVAGADDEEKWSLREKVQQLEQDLKGCHGRQREMLIANRRAHQLDLIT